MMSTVLGTAYTWQWDNPGWKKQRDKRETERREKGEEKKRRRRRSNTTSRMRRTRVRVRLDNAVCSLVRMLHRCQTAKPEGARKADGGKRRKVAIRSCLLWRRRDGLVELFGRLMQARRVWGGASIMMPPFSLEHGSIGAQIALRLMRGNCVDKIESLQSHRFLFLCRAFPAIIAVARRGWGGFLTIAVNRAKRPRGS